MEQLKAPIYAWALLLLICINDLTNVSNSIFFILFPDDTNVFSTQKSFGTLFQIENTDLVFLQNGSTTID